VSTPTTLVDLHLHTTASDGRCAPAELVDRAARAGLSVMSVTDHDTTAAAAAVRAAAGTRGIHTINGIEITAVDEQRDVHVLGYLFDPADAALGAFLREQRAARAARVEAIGARLAALGAPIDVRPLLSETSGHGRSIGRPQVARAMLSAGHVSSVQEAFDRYLAYGQPGFVPREGTSPAAVIAVIHAAGGIASLAHPGKRGLESRGQVRALAEVGLDAVEAFHPDHDAAAVVEYRQLARDLGLLVTGGSDFHGDPAHGLEPGGVTLPPADFERLCQARPDARA
jgi:predicted metal-dependent phosphoesterase TrpH